MEKKNWQILIVILIVISMIIVIAITNKVYYGNGFSDSSLQNEYTSLQEEYNTLTTYYNTLYENYETLTDYYNTCQTEYTKLAELTENYTQLTINHLMAMTYKDIREQLQPEYTIWSSTYHYNKENADYAALVCAHDLGRRHWPSIENDYYDKTGSYLTHDAHSAVSTIIELLGIVESDSDADKVEKILSFTSTYITYQSDKNDEFLFPIETITFRSGDCDDFSILAATLFEEVGIESAIELCDNESEGNYHCMVLVKLDNLGSYRGWLYSDLTAYGLSEGNWIILEPQAGIERQFEEDVITRWDIIAAAEIPN